MTGGRFDPANVESSGAASAMAAATSGFVSADVFIPISLQLVSYLNEL